MPIQKWTLPDSYCGAEWPDYYVFLGQNRDSDALTRSNFRAALKRLGGETGEDDNGISLVTVVRESHWACGWIEWIAIHESNTAGIALANEMLEKIDDYPCLSEDDWSELEYTEAMEYWDGLSLSEKVDYCKDAKVSIFAARRSYDLPDRLYEMLTRN
jgi:hypothetical protein